MKNEKQHNNRSLCQWHAVH